MKQLHDTQERVSNECECVNVSVSEDAYNAYMVYVCENARAYVSV